jgi:methylenetetrahydrofolate reductase (NADPH)
MHITDLYKSNKPVVSYEIFPPKREDGFEPLFDTVQDLKAVNPSFVSVTYGAGGTTRDKTVRIASTIKNQIGIDVMAHLTCVGSTSKDIGQILDQLKTENITSILALRGDPPKGETGFVQPVGGFAYASDLVEYIKGHNRFGVAVAGYPEGHPEAPNLATDIQNLKKKTDNGAEVIITQLFFNNDDFLKFRDLARSAGIDTPIVPGIFPVLSLKATKRITELCGAKIPSILLEKLEAVQGSPGETEKIGIDFAIKQSEALLKEGLPGIHFYTMNKSRQIKEIYNAVKTYLV